MLINSDLFVFELRLSNSPLELSTIFSQFLNRQQK